MMPCRSTPGSDRPIIFYENRKLLGDRTPKISVMGSKGKSLKEGVLSQCKTVDYDQDEERFGG